MSLNKLQQIIPQRILENIDKYFNFLYIATVYEAFVDQAAKQLSALGTHFDTEVTNCDCSYYATTDDATANRITAEGFNVPNFSHLTQINLVHDTVLYHRNFNDHLFHFHILSFLQNASVSLYLVCRGCIYQIHYI